MKIKVTLFIFLVLCSFGVGFNAKSAAEKTSIFLIPHPDDEMFMAGQIVLKKQAGENVEVILFTDGSASNARTVINGDKYCYLHNRIHKLAEEGYKKLSKKDLTVARLKEWKASLAHLGVKSADILYAPSIGLTSTPNLFVDHTLTVEQAAGIISEADSRWPEAEYYTLSGGIDGNLSHPDHAAISSALQGWIEKERSHFFTDDPSTGWEIELPLAIAKQKRTALREYYYWSPARKRFAVGAHSVKLSLDHWLKESNEYVLPEN